MSTAARRERLLALLLCAFAYLYVFPHQAKLNNPNENVRLYMTASLVEEGRYEIDSLRQRWGWVNDAAKREGHLYSVKAPGTSLSGIPAYAAYRAYTQASGRSFERREVLWLCRVSACVLPTLVWLWFFHGWLLRRFQHRPLVHAVFFSTALGSLLYAHATMFASHTVAAAAAFGAFMLISDARQDSRRASLRACFAAGLLAAAVTWLEYPGLILSVGLTAYFAISQRQLRPLAAFAAGGLLPTLSMMHFQWKAFGSPFTPGHLFVETDALREAHQEGFYGAVGPSMDAVGGLTIDLGAGLFPLTPILIFALPGILLGLRDRARRADVITAASMCLLTLLAIASMNNWRGGWTMGPRYLAQLVPFMGFLALPALEKLAGRMPNHVAALALGCTAAGLVASGAPSVYYPHLPPEFTRPLPQLIAVLVSHDYAPNNGGNLLGIYGSASMLPLFGTGLMALAVCALPVSARGARLAVLIGGLVLGTMIVWPLWRAPAANGKVRGAVAFVTRRWWPEGHDRASVLARELRTAGRYRERDLMELEQLYLGEGRRREARLARRGQLKH